ncbi:hypothetical protein BBP40_005572 [Aspergillus hancockii]|nr:hypothetical protein BBP40_005572 [Aspergillus hancockii]
MVRPLEFLRTPTWLTNKAVEEVIEEAEEYGKMRGELVDILANEEQKLPDNQQRVSGIMKEDWETGTFWYTLVLTSPTGLFSIFCRQIRLRFRKLKSDDDEESHMAMP